MRKKHSYEDRLKYMKMLEAGYSVNYIGAVREGRGRLARRHQQHDDRPLVGINGGEPGQQGEGQKLINP